MRTVLIVVVSFAAVVLIEAVNWTVRFVRDRNAEELRRRLQSLGSGTRAEVGLLREGKLSGNRALDSLLRGWSLARHLDELLEQAELGITVGRLLGYCLLVALSIFVLGVVVGAGPVVALALAPLGLPLPYAFVSMARERRSRKITEQLPDALDMMGRSMRAGHALGSAFKMVATEMAPPVSVEFARAFEEQNLGMPFERAVAQMTKRAPSNRDLKIFAVSVIVQKETGGNLVEIIEKIADTVRQRYRFYGKLNTLTAEGRMSSYILGALPILTGIFISVINPPYARLLVTDSLGKMILGYAIVSWLLGFLWMRRMSKVTV
ncbi:MAG TPA: type II secretion system F family protein [Polyangia bacterium]|nr:type II secretion system F family protein [Polyangia bacterium]